jgi:predicted ATP-dependent endonuclease of OLD family
MITNLEIHNFRGLKDVTLRDLRRVNLLVGGNDTGKTSVLEALMLLLGDGSMISELPIMFRNNQTNGQQVGSNDDRENFWNWLFYDRDTANEIQLRITFNKTQNLGVVSQIKGVPHPVLARESPNQGKYTIVGIEQSNVRVSGILVPEGFRVSRLSTRPSNPVSDAEKYNQIALEAKGESRFEEIMREVEPRLKRLRYARLPGTTSPLVFVDLGLSRSVPSTQMGQAFNRILHIYAEILTSKTNVLLIDEIENGIFSESLPLIWKGLLAVCEQQDVQIFATTHSRECVMAAHEAARERGKDELSVQRLQLVKGNIEAVRLGEPHLEMAAEMGLEVRS